METEAIFKNSRVYYLALVVYSGILLFGYDAGIAGGVVSQDAFIEHFLQDESGNISPNRITNVSGNVVSVLQAGAFFGALGSAPISARIGRKHALLSSCAICVIGAILQVIAGINGRGLAYIYTGRVIAGVGIGAISAVAPTFVSECSPKEVRGRITGLLQLMVAIGVMISYFVNFGISQHDPIGPKVWQIPFGVQLVPASIMCFGLLFVKESPRWLASRGRMHEALRNLAFLRKEPIDSDTVRHEMAEIEAAIEEERDARKGLGLKEAFFGKAIDGTELGELLCAANLFCSMLFVVPCSIYGIVKVIATSTFVILFVDRSGRKVPLAISSFGMGVLFIIIGSILKTHPPPAELADGVSPPAASKAMAALLYIYVTFFSIGWGPIPWVYCSDIFPTRTRHYGLALGAASQWLWNFVLSRATPNMIETLGYKIFIMFGALNIGALFTFALAIPETKGRSLEEMDIIFGSVSRESREAKVKETERVLENEILGLRSELPMNSQSKA